MLSFLFILKNYLFNNFYKCQNIRGSISIQPNEEAEIPWPVFLYPASYGPEKYRLRQGKAMENSSCIFLSHRSATDALKNMEQGRNVNDTSVIYSTDSNGTNSFGGSLSLEERKSFFQYDGSREISCGFLSPQDTGFKVSSKDRQAMDSCRGLVVVSAIFGAYDKLRQPRHVKKITAQSVCFFMFVDQETLESLAHNNIRPDEFHKIGLWRVVLVTSLPYNTSVMNGVIPKHLIHRIFPNSIYSIWVDAKLQLVVDPFIILDALLIRKNGSMAIAKHPYNIHTMEEAIFTVRWHKWNKQAVLHQMESYCKEGLQPWNPSKLPFDSDVPDTGLILRKHEIATNLFSCLLFNELEAFNPRDQLAFAYVRDMMSPKPVISMFEVGVYNSITSEYRHNILVKKESMVNNLADTHLQESIISLGQKSACQNYLNTMWDVSPAH
ncbi:hypothetical protein SUGI_0498710 [Cryptomeria japonica]|nr:hypothetical protein SUGI_0498710 [Cryptomeria japonica]